MQYFKQNLRRLSVLAALTFLSAACVSESIQKDHEEKGDDVPELTFDTEAVQNFEPQNEWSISPPLSLDEGANRVALMGNLDEGFNAPTLRVRGVDGEVTGPWMDAQWTFNELGNLAGFGELDGVYVSVQVAIPNSHKDAFESLTFSPAFVDESETFADIEAVQNQDESALRGELAFVGVLPRSAWGARNHRCSRTDSGRSRMALHHTAAKARGNVESQLRQAQAYHMDGRGYCDIAYQFAVAQDGRIFELRPHPYRGGHTRNNNSNNIGVVFNGCFHSTCGNDVPTPELIRAGAGIIALHHLLDNIEINSDKIRGHRDHSHASTACPGGTLYPRLEEMRAQARQIIADLNAGTQEETPAPPPPAPEPENCGVLLPNSALGQNESVTSCNGRFVLVHQGDGNVVLYQGGTALWHTHTYNQSSGSLVFQGDGNFVLYAPNGAPLWHTHTYGNAGAVLRVQDDGNVVIYSVSGRVLWARR